MSSFDEDDLEWNTSNITGFSFGDDDETPWTELIKNQTTLSGATSSGTPSEFVISSDKASTVVSDKVKKAVRHCSAIQTLELSGLSISEAVGGSNASIDNNFIPTDPRELRAEVARLRKQLKKVEETRFRPLHPKETVKNIFLGQRFSLEFYKNFQDKKDLIDEALKLQDGDAILVVTLFLRRTLSHAKFLELMSTRPVAVKHLANFYEYREKFNDVTDLLTSLGQQDKAAIIQYKQACRIPNVEARTRRIKTVLQSHFHGNQDSQLLISHVNLLERILPVHESDGKNPVIASSPHFPALNLRNETVLSTLLYLCIHHFHDGETLLSSPTPFKKMHGVGDAQFTWIALMGRARAKDWKECENLVVTKGGWLMTKVKRAKASVDPVGVVRILYQCEAPRDVLFSFLNLIEDLEEREEQARKYQVPNVVIDCLVAKRDRLALLKYKERLTDNSQDWFYADHALNTSNTKWKN